LFMGWRLVLGYFLFYRPQKKLLKSVQLLFIQRKKLFKGSFYLKNICYFNPYVYLVLLM
jgi:hypothetical protein